MSKLSNIFHDIDLESMISSSVSAGADSFEGTKTQFLTDNIIPSDVFLLSGQGAVLETNKGDIIDLCSMTVNCALGQNDPWVKANVLAYVASDRPSFHSTKFGSESFYRLPQRLSDIEIAGIRNARVNHRQCNGSDVTELAVKMAHYERADRNRVVSFGGSYHGQNMTNFLISETQLQHQFLSVSQSVTFLPAPTYTDPSDLTLSAEDKASLDRLEALAPDTFAIVIEPIQMNNGVNVVGTAFMQRLAEISRNHNICLIYDEIQTAFGWLGTLTAAEKYGATPDILCASKALTSGFGPLAVAVSNEKYTHLEYGTGEKTGGGDVRSLVAANAVLDRLLGLPEGQIPPYVQGKLRQELQNGLLVNVSPKATILDDLLKGFVQSFPNRVAGIRGDQMIKGIELVDESGEPDSALAKAIVQKALEQGVFIKQTKNVLIIKPPIVITEEQMKEGLSRLHDAFESILKPASLIPSTEVIPDTLS